MPLQAHSVSSAQKQAQPTRGLSAGGSGLSSRHRQSCKVNGSVFRMMRAAVLLAWAGGCGGCVQAVPPLWDAVCPPCPDTIWLAALGTMRGWWVFFGLVVPNGWGLPPTLLAYKKTQSKQIINSKGQNTGTSTSQETLTTLLGSAATRHTNHLVQCVYHSAACAVGMCQ